MSKERRTYLPRIVGDKVMMPADLKRLHKYMLEIVHITTSRMKCALWSKASGPSWRTSCRRRNRRIDHANVRFWLRVQLVTATLLVVYRQGFRSPRSSAGVD